MAVVVSFPRSGHGYLAKSFFAPNKETLTYCSNYYCEDAEGTSARNCPAFGSAEKLHCESDMDVLKSHDFRHLLKEKGQTGGIILYRIDLNQSLLSWQQMNLREKSTRRPLSTRLFFLTHLPYASLFYRDWVWSDVPAGFLRLTFEELRDEPQANLEKIAATIGVQSSAHVSHEFKSSIYPGEPWPQEFTFRLLEAFGRLPRPALMTLSRLSLMVYRFLNA